MIVRPRPSALALFFVMRGSIIPRIFGKILVITLLSCVVVWMYHRLWFSPAHLTAVPFSLFGLALSVFMGFRNNVCYDRWWEARKQWGDLIVQARSLARESAVLLAASTANPIQERLVRRCIGFGYGLAARLRGQDMVQAVRPWVQQDELDTLAGCRNVPDALLMAINRDLAGCLRRGELSDILYQALTQRVAQCAAIQAACERIKFTPCPFAYSLLLHRTATIFCLTLPFALAGALGWWTLLPAVLVSYTFFGLDALGDQLEDPFGLEPNDLPIDAMTRTVEREMLSALGETTLPPPIEAKANILT